MKIKLFLIVLMLSAFMSCKKQDTMELCHVKLMYSGNPQCNAFADWEGDIDKNQLSDFKSTYCNNKCAICKIDCN